MEITSDDDLEVAAVLAKGLGQGIETNSQQKTSDSMLSGQHSEQSPRRSSTVLTNHSRGNTATVTPSISRETNCSSIHQMAAKGELLMLQRQINMSQVDEVDDHGLTPLMWAAMYGQGDVVRLLLQVGAQPNITDPRGLSPLMTACYHGNVDVVKALLATRLSIDMVGEDGNTCLFYAVFGNHAECTRLLLERGSDLTLRNHQGHSVLDVAIKLQHKQVQKTIEQYLIRSLEGS